MRRQTDVIRQQMEGTREALAEKLGQLEDTLAGKVGKAVKKTASAVNNITETVEEKVEEVGDTVQDTVEMVKKGLSLRRQVDRHPWAMFGAAAFVGYVVGTLIPSRRRYERDYRSRDYRPREEYRPREAAHKPSHGNGHGASTAAKVVGAASTGLGLISMFTPALDRLRALALDTTMGVARQMIRDYLPASVAQQVEQSDVFRSLAGGTTGVQTSEQVASQNRTEGERHERNQSEMGRSVGPAPRSRQKPVG